jgi:hypothetical protein
VIHEFTKKEIEQIAARVAEGLDIADFVGPQSRRLFKFRRQMRNRMLEVMTRVRDFGIGQVNAELKRQT